MYKYLIFLTFCTLTGCLAWNGQKVAQGDYTLEIAEIKTVVTPDIPTQVKVFIANNSQENIVVELLVHKLADDWRTVGVNPQTLEIAGKMTSEATFQIVSGPKVYSMPYPVHVRAHIRRSAGEVVQLDAVRIFPVKMKSSNPTFDQPPEMPVMVLRDNTSLNLCEQQRFLRMAWQYYDQPLRYKPVGWLGVDAASHAAAAIHGVTCTGVAKRSLDMHPAWQPTCGPVFCDFKVKLPRTTPVVLDFHVAERMNRPDETPSDGVLYRVWAIEGDQLPKCLYENFTDTKAWLPGKADLSAFAGKTVTLRLESNPGPHRHVFTDSSYWGEPVLRSGDGQGATTAAGTNGLLDDWFVAFNGRVEFRGFDIELDGMPLQPSSLQDFKTSTEADGVILNRCRLLIDGRTTTLDFRMTASENWLKIHLSCDNRRITKAGLGPWRHPVARLYYGHGYVIQNPGDMRVGFGGHNFSSSHIGLEFNSRPAVLVAVDNPPLYLDSVASLHRCTPVTSDSCTFTIVTADNAFNAALLYQPLMDKSPAPTFPLLAGRLLFDIWGGSFKSIAQNLRQAVKYGLTDCVLTMHNWQRWGYDYRLPDIWPPNHNIGSISDLQDIGRLCDQHGILWGLHDNCTDFYPDADNFSIRNTFFWTPDGNPALGWYNRGRKAQALWFRPDATHQFVRRNYTEMVKHIRPTHSFVDVITSVACIEYYDDEGGLHTPVDTRQAWRGIFDEIRRIVGPNTTTTSEAGNDQFIGYLAGADCQWLNIGTKGSFTNRFPNTDWERVPWSDAVNHHRFAWLGAGYSIRYQSDGLLTREEHGIDSDDYLSAVLLAGHSLMADSGDWGYPVVRLYWLAQDFIRYIATCKMQCHEFIDGNIHHQFVEWENGARIWVNRGAENWAMRNGQQVPHLLPPYGFYAEYGGGRQLALEIRDGRIREYSNGPSWEFCNAHSAALSPGTQNLVQAEPSLVAAAEADDGMLEYTLQWKVTAPPDKNWRTFVHFRNSQNGIEFQDDHLSNIPPSQWRPGQTITDKRRFKLPAKPMETSYSMKVGLYTPQLNLLPVIWGGRRSTNVQVATLKITRADDGTIKAAVLEPQSSPPPMKLNENAGKNLQDFNYLATNGVCRLQKLPENRWELVPAPNMPDFDIELHLDKLFPNHDAFTLVQEEQDGTTSSKNINGKDLRLKTTRDVFKYTLSIR